VPVKAAMTAQRTDKRNLRHVQVDLCGLVVVLFTTCISRDNAKLWELNNAIY